MVHSHDFSAKMKILHLCTTKELGKIQDLHFSRKCKACGMSVSFQLGSGEVLNNIWTDNKKFFDELTEDDRHVEEMKMMSCCHELAAIVEVESE